MLVEKVMLQFKAQLGAQLNATPMHHRDDWSAMGGEVNLTDLSRAAVATVFDWLAEPGDEAVLDAVEAWHKSPALLDDETRSVWTAMLAAMRKEALG